MVGVGKELKETSDIISDIRSHGIRKIFYSGGRGEHFIYAIDSIKDHLISGLGWGHFYALSESGYALHFTYLIWIFCFGIPGAAAMLLGIWLFTGGFLPALYKARALCRISEALVLSIGIYIALAHTIDVFITYRPILYLLSFIFLWVLFRAGVQQPPVIAGRIIALSLAAGSLAGMATVRSPQNRVPLTKAYQAEHSEGSRPGPFNWYALATHRRLPPRRCWSGFITTNLSEKSPALDCQSDQVSGPQK